MSKKKLATDFLVRFPVTLAERTVGIVLAPILLASLGVEGYGYYCLGLSIVNAFSSIATLRLPTAIIKFYPEERKDAGPVVVTGLSLWACITGVSAVALLCGGRPLANVLLGSPLRLPILVASVAAASATILYELAGITLRAECRFGKLSIADVTERFLYLVLCILALRLRSGSVTLVLLLMTTTMTLKTAWVGVTAFKGIEWRWPRRRLVVDMFLFSIPLLPYLAGNWVITQSGFLFISSHLKDPTGLGTYGVAFTLGGLLGTLAAQLQVVLYPMTRRAYDAGRYDEVKETLTTGVRFSLVIAGIGMTTICLGTPHIFALLSIAKAVPPLSLQVVICIAFAVAALNQIVVNLMIVAGKTRALVWVSGASALCSLSFYFLPLAWTGILGAALAFLVGITLQTALCTMRLPKAMLPAPSGPFLLALVASSAIAAVVQWTSGLCGHWGYVCGLVVSALVYLSLLFRFGAVTTAESLALRRMRDAAWQRYCEMMKSRRRH